MPDTITSAVNNGPPAAELYLLSERLVNTWGSTLLRLQVTGTADDKDQQDPASGAVSCTVSYIFSGHKTVLEFAYDNDAKGEIPRIIIPVISTSVKGIRLISPEVIEIKKENAVVRISANHPWVLLPAAANGRVFNVVPVLEALPLAIDQNNARVTIEVLA